MKTNHLFRILSLLAATVLLSACSKEPADESARKGWPEGQPFFYYYIDLENANTFITKFHTDPEQDNRCHIVVRNDWNRRGGFRVIGGGDEYKALQAEYGDYGPAKTSGATDAINATKAISPLNYSGLAKRVKSLDVIAKTDYDDAHPAGSLLNDVLSLVYWDIEAFIKDGYPASENPIWNDPKITAVDGYNIHRRYLKITLLKEYNQGAPKLFHFPEDFHIISLNHSPTMNVTTQLFTIRFTFEDGQTIEIETETPSVMSS